MWCRSAVNRIFLSLAAARRTGSSALGAPARLCVRGAFCWGRFPLAQSPFLCPLRRRLPGLVRGLHWYFGTVRLPELVHRRRASLDFPTRPAAPSVAGEPRTSRFSCEVFPYVHGVSDRAGPGRISRYRCVRWCLPLLPTASASRRDHLSRLNTRPARTPVNASMLPSRGTPHDSGPLWVAKPSAYDSFIHNTSPVYPGARGVTERKTGMRLWCWPRVRIVTESAAGIRSRVERAKRSSSKR
jgi:hypothetical protein